MKFEDSGPEPAARTLVALSMTLMLAVLVLPSSASGETVLKWRDSETVISSAVSHYYHKTVERNVIESVCYFDPNVENSMRCSWASGSGGVDPFRLKQMVKRNATKWCKKAGGRKCVLFWRSGTLQFAGLSPEQSEKLELVLGKMPDYDSEAALLPDGVGVGSKFRDQFPRLRDRLEEIRKKRRGHNLHYAICTNERGPSATFRMQGSGTHMTKVRNMCVLKCNAFSEYLSKEGECYVVYEDGKFVSAAAEKAVMQ